MADNSYSNVLVYRKQNSTELIIASSGLLTVESGGEITIESGGTLDVESGGGIDLESGGDLDVESGGHIDVASGGYISLSGYETVNSAGYINVASGGYIKVSTGGMFCNSVYIPATSVSTSLDPTAVNIIERGVDSQTIYLLPQPTYAGQKCSVILTKNAGSSCWVYIQSTGAGYDSTGSTNLRIADNNQSVDLIALGTTRWAVLNKTTGVTILADT